ncbi:host specificity factor TipJ family phage tail protein [Pseudomonas hunanensis]|uniref:host specificity factor TipJ family phage tail protein n=1 Tax=Pseudomonas hunanensis TaxID=1247546 RepID=UPI0038008C27
MIEIYPSKLEGAPLERHPLEHSTTLEGWLKAKVPSYEPRPVPPISILVNGHLIEPSQWGETEVEPTDQVSIYIEPKGSALKTIFKPGPLAKMFGLGNPFDPATPVTPGTQNRTSRDLDLSTVKGNQVALNDIIPELAGSPKRYPDLLLPIHRYFGSEREQWSELLLCVGKGRYQILPSDIMVGDTPIASLGNTASYKIFEPGADLSGETASVWWHSAKEVGSTSTGSAGLTLSTTTSVAQEATAATVQFAGHVLTVPEFAGWFPHGWAAGMIARIEVLYPYTFTAPVDGGATVISGDHVPMLKPSVGMKIEITGANAGEYVVASYAPFVPGVPAVPGTASSVTGNSAPTRYDFNATPLAFTLVIGAQAFPILLDTATTNLAGLVSAMNAALNGTGLVASAAGAMLKLAEANAPFSGNALSLTAEASQIFGSAPVFVTGVKTEAASSAQPAQMTLAYDGGAPAVGLQTGVQWSCIGYRDLRYRITAVSEDAMDDDDDTEQDEGHGPSAITVERLTDSGSSDTAWAGFDPLESNSSTIVLDGSTTEGDWSGPYAAVPPRERTRRLELDFFFPGGLVRYTEKNGNIRSHWAKVEVQYRDIETAGAWTSRTYTFEAMTPDQVAYTRSFALPASMRPEVRVRRIGEESTSSNKQDRVQWYGLKGRISRAPKRYEGVTVMSVYIKGSNRLSAQSETMVSTRPTRILPVRRGGRWVDEEPTRSIAPWVLHVGKSIGYLDDDLHLAEFDRLSPTWDARGDTFDLAVTEQSTVIECMNKALAAGFSEVTIDRGQIRPVRDQPRSVFEHMYTPQNMTGNLVRNFSTVRPDDYDGVDVEYVDERTWQKETVICRLPGDAGSRVEKVTLDGVVNRDRAWRIGMRQRRRQRYQRRSYSWSTELDGLNSSYLSYCAVADDIPGYGQSAVLEGMTRGNGLILLESSEPLVWEQGASHVVGLRRPDGTLSGPWAARRVDDYRLTILDDLDFEPDLSWDVEAPHLLFGEVSRWCYPVLVKSVEPGDYSADIEGVNYDERIYLDDDNNAPN